MLSSEAIRQKTRLSLKILGNLTLEDDHGKYIKISNHKACGLLAYLAVNGTTTETRERLAGLLWSDRTEERVRASHRQCIKCLRDVFNTINFNGFTTVRNGVVRSASQIEIELCEMPHGHFHRRSGGIFQAGTSNATRHETREPRLGRTDGDYGKWICSPTNEDVFLKGLPSTS